MLWSSGYETGERSSLGKRGERCQRQIKRPERSAAVDIFKAASSAAENIGHRKPGCRTNRKAIAPQLDGDNSIRGAAEIIESCLRNQKRYLT